MYQKKVTFIYIKNRMQLKQQLCTHRIVLGRLHIQAIHVIGIQVFKFWLLANVTLCKIMHCKRSES
jgi:hypothetical protein